MKGSGVLSELAFMLTGIAIGGPRHGVKLSAGPNWNGVVRYQSPGSSAPETGIPYPGRYVFDPVTDTWVWEEAK